MSDKTALVVSAHSADFVWRAGGAIALHTEKGFAVTVICLSYGERGESAKLWRQSGMTLERVKAERQKEAEAAAQSLGVADIQFWDLGDYGGTTDTNSEIIKAGLLGGLVGAVTIWIYEAIVWVSVQHLMPMAGIPRNATGLVFGRDVQESLGAGAYIVGTGIHFVFALSWGVLFAFIWPALRARRIEATLAALAYAVIAWIVMHVAIAVVSSNHPNYLDPNVIIGGFMSHFFFTVPLALVIKHRLAAFGDR